MVKGRRDADEMFARIGTSGYFNIYAMQSGRDLFECFAGREFYNKGDSFYIFVRDSLFACSCEI